MGLFFGQHGLVGCPLAKEEYPSLAKEPRGFPYCNPQ